MTQPPPFDATALHDLIATPYAWPRILSLITQKHWDRSAAQWLPQAQRALDLAYPDEQRVWPQEWYTKKVAPAATPLARKLLLPPSTPAALTKLTAQLATLDAATMPPLTILRVKLYPRAKPIHFTTYDADTLWAKLAQTPLREVEIDYGPPTKNLWDAMAGAPALRAVERITCEGAPPDATVAAILSTPHLTTLRHLTLRPTSMSAAAPALIERHAATMESLTLEAPYATRLADLWAARWPALRSLTLWRMTQGPDAMRRILDAAPALQRLRLREVGPLDGQALDDSAHTALEELWLEAPGSDAQVAALLSSPACAGLKELLLRRHEEPGALTGAALRRLTRLERLDLYHTTEPSAALWDALRGASLPALRSLELGWSAHLDSGALDALETMDLPALTYLSCGPSANPDQQARAQALVKPRATP